MEALAVAVAAPSDELTLLHRVTGACGVCLARIAGVHEVPRLRQANSLIVSAGTCVLCMNLLPLLLSDAWQTTFADHLAASGHEFPASYSLGLTVPPVLAIAHRALEETLQALVAVGSAMEGGD